NPLILSFASSNPLKSIPKLNRSPRTPIFLITCSGQPSALARVEIASINQLNSSPIFLMAPENTWWACSISRVGVDEIHWQRIRAFFRARSCSYSGRCDGPTILLKRILSPSPRRSTSPRKRFRYFDCLNSLFLKGTWISRASAVNAAATITSRSQTLNGSHRSIHLRRLRHVSTEIPICAVTFPLSVAWSLSWTSLFRSPQLKHLSIMSRILLDKASPTFFPESRFQDETPV